ncbi:MAG: DMT family transporter [Candidatus Zixiibacteriota bacterium]
MPALTSRSLELLADTGLFYAAAIWGATFFMVKDALSGIDPIVMVAYRFLLAGSIMAVVVRMTGRDIRRDFKASCLLATMLWFLYVPQTVGLKYTTASNSGFITGLFVIFVPISMRWLFHKRPSIMEWVACGVALIGLWILTGGLTDINVGDILTLAAAVTYALHVLYSDKYLRLGADPLVISCQQFLLVGLLSLVTAFVFGLDMRVHTPAAAWTTIFLALFPTLTAFVIQMWAQRITAPVKVSLIFAFEPVFAGLFAWTLGDEPLVAHRAIGGLFIFAALVVSGLPAPRRRQ